MFYAQHAAIVLLRVVVRPDFEASGARSYYRASACLSDLLEVVLCIVFSGSYWIATLFVIMGLAIAVVYLGSTVSFIKLRLSHPEWKRSYKVPLGLLVGTLGVFGSGFCVYWSMVAMTIDGWYLMISYILMGVVFYFAMRYYRKKKGLNVKLMPPVE